jgi:hypothetical protein
MTYSWFLDDNPLVLGFVPQLSKLSLSNTRLSDKTLMLSQLLANVRTVRELYLNFQSEKVLTPIIHVLLSPFICIISYLSGSFHAELVLIITLLLHVPDLGSARMP